MFWGVMGFGGSEFIEGFTIRDPGPVMLLGSRHRDLDICRFWWSAVGIHHSFVYHNINGGASAPLLLTGS